jgi:hypothetical protein
VTRFLRTKKKWFFFDHILKINRLKQNKRVGWVKQKFYAISPANSILTLITCCDQKSERSEMNWPTNCTCVCRHGSREMILLVADVTQIQKGNFAPHQKWKFESYKIPKKEFWCRSFNSARNYRIISQKSHDTCPNTPCQFVYFQKNNLFFWQIICTCHCCNFLFEYRWKVYIVLEDKVILQSAYSKY